jgi:hypothetical protein
VTEVRDDENASEIQSREPGKAEVKEPVAEATPTEAQVEQVIASDSKSSRKVLIAILVAILGTKAAAMISLKLKAKSLFLRKNSGML